MPLRALTWNLFHGRDHPPNPDLITWRSRLLRISEREGGDVQVNRDLLSHFRTVLANAEWDVALLQECPPRWDRALAQACGAAAHRALTSRNSLAPLRAALARLNPDLIGANEGGSNLTLVRGRVIERTELELTPGPFPERRVMAFTRAVPDRCGDELYIANLHASAGRSRRTEAEREVLLAARRATGWAGRAPLLLGGDLNLRPRDSNVFELLHGRYGLSSPSDPASLDHLLVRGLAVDREPSAWPLERRRVRTREGAITLSDHAPVEASFLAPNRQLSAQPGRT